MTNALAMISSSPKGSGMADQSQQTSYLRRLSITAEHPIYGGLQRKNTTLCSILQVQIQKT